MPSTPHRYSFDYWAALADSDPQAFESARREVLRALIEAAPAADRRRLNGLQWRVDRTRELAPTALAGAGALAELMWDGALGERGLVAQIGRLTGPPSPAAAGRGRASVSVLGERSAPG